MATLVKVKKWGRSLAVRIPGRFAKMRQIKVGTVIDLEAVKVIGVRRRYKLSDLAARLKPEHFQGEWSLGGPIGKEIW